MAQATPSPANLSPDVLRTRLLRDFRTVWGGRARRGMYQPRMSSAGKCVRALTYHRRGIPESNPATPRAGLRFEIGDLLHAYLDKKLRRLRYPLELREHRLELRTPSGLVITGHFDRSLAGTTILDYKSASDAAFRMMVDRNEPLSDYVAQITEYLEACARTPGLEQYMHGLFVVVNKDSRDKTRPDIEDVDLWISPPIARNPVLAQQITEKFDAVERHAQASTLPERPYPSPAEYPCKFCAWRDRCWGATLPKTTSVVIDLSAVRGEIERYEVLGAQIRELEREREQAAGPVRAALTDAGTREGAAADLAVKLVTEPRRVLRPDLPPDLREQATTVIEVTKIRVTRSRAPAPTDASAPSEVPSGVPSARPASVKSGETQESVATATEPAVQVSAFLQTGHGEVITHADFLAFIGRAAAREIPGEADPVPAWLRRHGLPTDLTQLTPSLVDRALTLAQEVITPPTSVQRHR